MPCPEPLSPSDRDVEAIMAFRSAGSVHLVAHMTAGLVCVTLRMRGDVRGQGPGAVLSVSRATGYWTG